MQPRTFAAPWWREPMMWLVLGGPAVVVVAAIVTAVIAWQRADTVLVADSAYEPATHARNHAVTPAKAAR